MQHLSVVLLKHARSHPVYAHGHVPTIAHSRLLPLNIDGINNKERSRDPHHPDAYGSVQRRVHVVEERGHFLKKKVVWPLPQFNPRFAMFLRLAAFLALSASERAALVAVDMGAQSLYNKEALAIADLLPQCKNLEELLLGLNSIGDAGVKSLMSVLPMTPKLKTLGVSGYDIIISHETFTYSWARDGIYGRVEGKYTKTEHGFYKWFESVPEPPKLTSPRKSRDIKVDLSTLRNSPRGSGPMFPKIVSKQEMDQTALKHMLGVP